MTTTVPQNVTPFPALKPGHHLAPAAIQRGDGAPQIVFIECPDWCTENHVEKFVHFLEDVDHKGDDFSVSIPSFWSGRAAYQLTVSLASDPMSSDPQMRAAHVIVGNEGSVDAYLTPEMVDEAAADLRKLAAKLDEAARTARLHNQAETLAVA